MGSCHITYTNSNIILGLTGSSIYGVGYVDGCHCCQDTAGTTYIGVCMVRITVSKLRIILSDV